MRFQGLVKVVAMTICGGFFAVANVFCFSPYWYGLGWRQPVAEWIVEIGLGDAIAGQWGLVWLRIPERVLASILGIASGLCAGKTWLMTSISCALAFVFTPDLLMYVSGEQNPLVFFGTDIVIAFQFWRMPSFAFVLLFGLFGSRLRANKEDKPSL